MSKKLTQQAKELLEGKQVEVVIGHGQGSSKERSRPIFITSPEQTDRLTLEGNLSNNLAIYLTRPEVKRLGRPGLVARPREIKSLVGLVQENQLSAEEIVILGVKCDQRGNPDGSGEVSEETTLEEQIKILKERYLAGELRDDLLNEVRELEKLSEEERWRFWQEQFSRCIKCYACREACPFCYCTRCIVEKNQPQWIDTSPHLKGQYSWNITRTFHLSGRCIGCDACYFACPMNIPLYLLNRELAKRVKEIYGYIAGYDYQTEPPLATFKPEDKEDFIR